MRRVRPELYATTYPGIGIGFVAEWVSHNLDGAGSLEIAFALPFLTLNFALTFSPHQPRKAHLARPDTQARRELPHR